MKQIPIYKAEAEAGLSAQLQTNTSISYYVPLQPAKVEEATITQYVTEAVDKFDLDILYPTKSVLVSSTWNRNDDVFGVADIWAARHTPVHKPTNINHDHNQIVGHITSTWVVDSDGSIVNDDTVIDDLPSTIHICNGAVIYKHYKEEDLTARAIELINQIEANEKFVSMECLFPDFDYAVIGPDDEKYTIARNEETAFLTKHLRAYGGLGEFNGYKVGRYLKDMIFSGKGYVDKPANPESIIFTDEKPDFSFSDAIYKSSFNFENGVDNNMSETPQMSAANVKNSKETIMSDTNDVLKTELAEAKSEINKLRDKLADSNVEQLRAQIAQLESEVEAQSKDKEAVTVELTATKASLDTLTESLKEATQSKEALEAEIEKAKAEKLFNDRIDSLVEIGLTKERATEAAEKFVGLSDEQFNEAKSLFGEMKRESEADRDSDPKMSDEDVVKSNQGTEAAGDCDNKGNDKKKKDKEDSSDAELDDVLESAEVDADDTTDLGATESDDESNEVTQTRESVASYFANRFGLQTANSDE